MLTARRTPLECIQGIIVLFFVLCSLGGVSSRARCLVAQSITMARELALHSIDYPGNSSAANSVRTNIVRTEIGRRVWWYLAATDWSVSTEHNPAALRGS